MVDISYKKNWKQKAQKIHNCPIIVVPDPDEKK